MRKCGSKQARDCALRGHHGLSVHTRAHGSSLARVSLMSKIDGMTQAKWDRMTDGQRCAVRDLSGLNSQLVGLEGWRIEVVRCDGTRDRFNVSRSTGWRPCHIELRRITSTGGMAADNSYHSVTRIRKVR